MRILNVIRIDMENIFHLLINTFKLTLIERDDGKRSNPCVATHPNNTHME